jgi:hypothetical protein
LLCGALHRCLTSVLFWSVPQMPRLLGISRFLGSFILVVILILCLAFAVAIAQGVRPEQIIFTDVAAKNEHIRRSSLADLFLDSYVSTCC